MGLERYENSLRSKKFWLTLFPGITALIYFFTAGWINLLSAVTSPLVIFSFIFNLIFGPIYGLLGLIAELFGGRSFAMWIAGEGQAMHFFLTSQGIVFAIISVVLFAGYIYFVNRVEKMDRKKLLISGTILLLLLLYSTIRYLWLVLNMLGSPLF